jgi:hypothetical protein
MAFFDRGDAQSRVFALRLPVEIELHGDSAVTAIPRMGRSSFTNIYYTTQEKYS